MRIWVVLALLAACKQPGPEWKQRTGPDYTVEAPYEGKQTHVPVPGNSTDMTVYLYANEPEWSLQVQVVELPKTAIPMQVIVAMRDRAAERGKIVREQDVAMGDAPGKDIWFTAAVPQLGQANVRDRIVMQAHKVYQVMFVERAGTTGHEADGDRFIDSFKLTGAPLDIQTAYHEAVGSNAPPVEVHEVAGKPDADGWYTAHSVAGRFTVRLPGPFNEAHSDLGDEGVMNMLSTVKMPERVKMSAACIDGSKKAKTLDEAAAMPGVTSHKERDVQGHRAIEITVGNATALDVERNGGICVLSVEPYSKTAPLPLADAEKMFSSLELE